MRHPSLRSHAFTTLAALLVAAALPVSAGAAGPWSAVVLDAHTGAPLEGVVVVATWNRRARGHPAIGLGTPGLFAVEEVLTDGQGRFTLRPGHS